MKKFLLSCCLALGIGTQAQYNYLGDFEDPGYSTTIYKQFSGGTRTTDALCNGQYGGQLALGSLLTSTGYMVDLSTISQTGNGQQLTVSASYKKASGIVGTISLAYFIYDADTTLWTIYRVGTIQSITTDAITTCTPLTATIPAGALQPGQVAGVGVWVTRTSGSGNVYVDDISIAQEVVNDVPQSCATWANPTAGATISGGNVNLSWSNVPTAVNYKLTIGTTSGGSDVLNTIVSSNSFNTTLPTGTTFYAKVVPTNLVGDAVGCTEITFDTDSSIAYCGPITASSTVYPISSVVFNGTTKTSSAATGSPAYEDFTSTILNGYAGGTYPITITGTGLNSYRFGATVFIDWNEDGDFADAGEQYFTTSPFLSNTLATNVLTGNIAIPSTVTAGNKRVRIKYNYNASATSIITALSDPCESMGNGQVEDYTLAVTVHTNVPECTTITAPTEGATVPQGSGTITWAAAEGATAYKLSVGTTSGGSDIFTGTVISTSQSVTLPSINTTYYAKVVPTNSVGDATGCPEISFQTGSVYIYCTAAATSTSTSFEKIGNVAISNVNNPSTSAIGYEDFTAIVINGKQGLSYPITVDVTNGYSSDKVYVWVDFNHDGIFTDAAPEKFTLNYDNTTKKATGDIAIPSDAFIGETRFRIRLDDSTSSGANSTPCGNSTYGQVEDYTLKIADPTLAVSNANSAKISLYPNPFTDILRISDTKDVVSVVITDISGRTVKTLSPALELNLSGLNTGLYIVSLKMKDGSMQTFKAIKK